jgi:hypothetical protein
LAIGALADAARREGFATDSSAFGLETVRLGFGASSFDAAVRFGFTGSSFDAAVRAGFAGFVGSSLAFDVDTTLFVLTGSSVATVLTALAGFASTTSSFAFVLPLEDAVADRADGRLVGSVVVPVLDWALVKTMMLVSFAD